MLGHLSPNPDLLVRHTHTSKGRGVFAKRRYRAGETVESSPIMEVQAPWEALPRAVQLIVYEWGYLAGDPRPDVRGIALGMGSLFNHDDQPNLRYEAHAAERALVFTATRNIEPGEELTINYNADMDTDSGQTWFELMGIDPAQ